MLMENMDEEGNLIYGVTTNSKKTRTKDNAEDNTISE